MNTPEELYFQATYFQATGAWPGDDEMRGVDEPPPIDPAQPLDPSYSVKAAENGILDDDDVLAVVTAYAGQEAADFFPMRYNPGDGPHPGNRVLVRPVLCPDGRYLAVSFRMGHEDPDEMISFKPDWLGIDGPFTLQELEAFGRAAND